MVSLAGISLSLVAKMVKMARVKSKKCAQRKIQKAYSATSTDWCLWYDSATNELRKSDRWKIGCPDASLYPANGSRFFM